MPLLDHFRPPLHGPRRWEGFHHAWATTIARQLNDGVLPPDYYAEPEITVGPSLEVDVATLESAMGAAPGGALALATWAPPRPKIAARVNFSRLDGYEVRVYQDLGGANLRAVIELVSPSNKDRPGSRATFAAKCAAHLQHGVAVVVVDIVTTRNANLHQAIFEVLQAPSRRSTWQSATGLYAIAYRPVTVRRAPRVEAWPETLALGQPLPTMPLWLSLDCCVPIHLENSYAETCRGLRISA